MSGVSSRIGLGYLERCSKNYSGAIIMAFLSSDGARVATRGHYGAAVEGEVCAPHPSRAAPSIFDMHIKRTGPVTATHIPAALKFIYLFINSPLEF